MPPLMAKNGFAWLLLTLLLMWIVSPFLENVETHLHILSSLTMLILLVSAWVVSRGAAERLIMLLLAFASACVFWIGSVGGHPWISAVSRICLFVYFAFISVMILRQIDSALEINANVLCGAASLFILISLAWAVSYWLINDLNPNTFTPPTQTVIPEIKFHHFLYFSMVTLTTLGYGDITPVGHFTQM